MSFLVASVRRWGAERLSGDVPMEALDQAICHG
jgi:hypothetical protein